MRYCFVPDQASLNRSLTPKIYKQRISRWYKNVDSLSIKLNRALNK